MSINPNQFALSPIKGLVDMKFNASMISVVVDSTETGTLVAGQAVKLVDSLGGTPKVVACAADTDDVFGFVAYNIKNSGFVAGDAMEISFHRGSIMYLEASAAIARGAKVMIVVTGQKVATATTGKMIVGQAFDKASASGDLIRVLVDLPASLMA
jgi:hypothetical protein